MASKSHERGKETGFECLWWSENKAGVRIVARDVNLLLVTDTWALSSAPPGMGQRRGGKGKA